MFQDIYLRIQWLKTNRSKYHLEELNQLLMQLFASKPRGVLDMLRMDLLYCLGKNHRWWHLTLFYEVVVDYIHQRFHIAREDLELNCDELFEFLLEKSLSAAVSLVDRDFIFFMLLAQDRQEFGFDIDNSVILRSSKISEELVLKCMMELDDFMNNNPSYKSCKRLDYLMGNYSAEVSSQSLSHYIEDIRVFLIEKSVSKKQLDPNRVAVLLSHRLIERTSAHTFELTPFGRKIFSSESTQSLRVAKAVEEVSSF